MLLKEKNKYKLIVTSKKLMISLAISSKYKHVAQTALLMQMEALQRDYTRFVAKLLPKSLKDLWHGRLI